MFSQDHFESEPMPMREQEEQILNQLAEQEALSVRTFDSPEEAERFALEIIKQSRGCNELEAEKHLASLVTRDLIKLESWPPGPQISVAEAAGFRWIELQ